MLYLLVDLIHILFLFTPTILLFVPKVFLTRKLIWVLYCFISLPAMWKFFGDLCPLTIISKKLGGLQNTTSNSAFSEKYLKWLYLPIIRLYGGKWNDENIDRMAWLHWVVNTLTIWYLIFYSGGNICNLKK